MTGSRADVVTPREAGFEAADECARTVAASTKADVAELLKPMIVPARVAEGLPIAQSMWEELTEHRARIFMKHVRQCREPASCSAVVVLARALNAVLDGNGTRGSKSRFQGLGIQGSVVSDELFLTAALPVLVLPGLRGSVDDREVLGHLRHGSPESPGSDLEHVPS